MSSLSEAFRLLFAPVYPKEGASRPDPAAHASDQLFDQAGQYDQTRAAPGSSHRRGKGCDPVGARVPEGGEKAGGRQRHRDQDSPVVGA